MSTFLLTLTVSALFAAGLCTGIYIGVYLITNDDDDQWPDGGAL